MKGEAIEAKIRSEMNALETHAARDMSEKGACEERKENGKKTLSLESLYAMSSGCVRGASRAGWLREGGKRDETRRKRGMQNLKRGRSYQ